VADGMGGLADGQDASAFALNALTARLSAACPSTLTTQHVHEAFLAAHEAVWQASRDRDRRMGTTLVAAVVRGEDALVANVGDSRCYLVTDGAIECLTRDHSLARCESSGVWGADLNAGIAASVLTRCVGASEEQPAVDLWRLHLSGNGALVLCSDGVHRSLEPGTLLSVITNLPDPQAAAEALVRRAIEAGAGDDLSAAVLCFEA